MSTEVSLPRLYALRVAYLLIAVFMGAQMWPLLFHHRPWELMHGVAVCMLAAVAAVALLGLRYPLRMLPLLIFELVWKTVWLAAIAWPAYRQNGHLDPSLAETFKACAFGLVLFPLVIPWPYAIARYLRAPGDRWTRPRAGA